MIPKSKPEVLQIIIITIITLIALEVMARLIFGKPPSTPETQIADNVLNHKWKPNLKYIDRSRSIPYHLDTNVQSWVEEYDLLRTKPENTLRIFYVGDSNTLGVVEPGKKMVDLVEKGLNSKLERSGKKIEVINTGTSSYSPILYYLLIKNEVLKYSPDIVVINVDMTDIRDDIHYKSLATFDKEGLPIAVVAEDPQRQKGYVLVPQGTIKFTRGQIIRDKLHEFLKTNSALSYHFENLIFSLPKPEFIKRMYKKPEVPKAVDYESGTWYKDNWSDDLAKDVDYSMFILENTSKLLKENKVKVVLSGVPHYPQFTGEWSDRPHEELAQTAKKTGVPYLHSYQEVKKRVPKTEISNLYWKEDPYHLNEEGNRIWAQIQLDFLLDPKNNLFSINSFK